MITKGGGGVKNLGKSDYVISERSFHGEASKEGIKCVCLSLMVIYSVFNSGQNYYSQAFLEECKYKIKEKHIKSFIGNNLKSSFVDDISEEKENSG